MMTCSTCGGSNDLGRVFCTTCGTKLELTAMTNETVPITARSSNVGKIVAVVVVMLLVLVIGLTGLCAFPISDAVGAAGSRNAIKNITGPLHSLQRLKQGQSLGRVFRESDINGYLDIAIEKRIRVRDLSVDVEAGAIVVRMTKKIGPFKIGSFKLNPAITYQVTYRVDGGTLQSGGARMGYMPLVGPLRKFAVRPIEEAVTAQREWDVFRDVKQIRTKKETVWVEISR